MLRMRVKQNFWGDGLYLNICNDFDSFQEMGAHLVAHGDGVKDVAFSVEDLDGIMITCKKKGVRWHDGWHDVWHDDWHVRLTWRLAWWLTATEGVGLLSWTWNWTWWIHGAKKSIDINQRHVGSPIAQSLISLVSCNTLMSRLETWSTVNHYRGHRHRHYQHDHQHHHTHCPQ